MGKWSLGTGFLISKSAEPGNGVTGRFGGPERSAQAEGEAVKDNNRSMMGRNAGAPVAAHARADDHSATPINRRMGEGVLQRPPEVRRRGPGAEYGSHRRCVSRRPGGAGSRSMGRDQRLMEVRGAVGREWRPCGRLEWGVPSGRRGRTATHTSWGRVPRPAQNKWASAYAAFGRSGETGPICEWSLGARFLISKSAVPGNEVTGRFGGPERSAQAEGEAVKDNNRSMMGRNAGAPVAAHARADDHSATPINRRMGEGVLQRPPEVRRRGPGAEYGSHRRCVSRRPGGAGSRSMGRDQRLMEVRGAVGREWRPCGRLEWGVPSGRRGRTATHTSWGRVPRPAQNKWASAYAAFGRSGETGPICEWSLGARFLISKSAEPGNEVTGRFGGPERYVKCALQRVQRWPRSSAWRRRGKTCAMDVERVQVLSSQDWGHDGLRV